MKMICEECTTTLAGHQYRLCADCRKYELLEVAKEYLSYCYDILKDLDIDPDEELKVRVLASIKETNNTIEELYNG